MENCINEVEVVTISEDGLVCIPRLARGLNGFQNGCKISVVICDDKIELRPLGGELSEECMCMIASEDALSENWLSEKDEEAWKDL
ncbi:MAG: AbrB/MazE/SpoVT family DNA-binding domain-containing protein [Nanoarchaeota archaeon]|nr:AbrB/MazE/SpoVT family DNA-binding domain-containing protein [Nanoarchaeota archaeon]